MRIEPDPFGIGRIDDDHRLVDHQQQVIVDRFRHRVFLSVGQILAGKVCLVCLVRIVGRFVMVSATAAFVSVLVMVSAAAALVSVLVVMSSAAALVSVLVVMSAAAAFVSVLVMVSSAAALVSVLVVMSSAAALVSVLVVVSVTAALVSVLVVVSATAAFVSVLVVVSATVMMPAAAAGDDPTGGIYEQIGTAEGLHAVFLAKGVLGLPRQLCHGDKKYFSVEVQWFHRFSEMVFMVAKIVKAERKDEGENEVFPEGFAEAHPVL